MPFLTAWLGNLSPMPLAAADAALPLVADAGLLGALQAQLGEDAADAALDFRVGHVAREPEPRGVPQRLPDGEVGVEDVVLDRKSTRLNSSHRT